MRVKRLPLEKQVEIVINQLKPELTHASFGTIFMHIRDNNIGKFGIKHEPITLDVGRKFKARKGLSGEQQDLFKRLAIEALALKHWTYGEMELEFAVRQDRFSIAVTFESNYNMSNHDAIRLVS
jgi:hypothetical protein